jgi:hypothetical protein
MPQSGLELLPVLIRYLPMWKLAFPGARLKVVSSIPYPLSPITYNTLLAPITTPPSSALLFTQNHESLTFQASFP